MRPSTTALRSVTHAILPLARATVSSQIATATSSAARVRRLVVRQLRVVTAVLVDDVPPRRYS